MLPLVEWAGLFRKRIKKLLIENSKFGVKIRGRFQSAQEELDAIWRISRITDYQFGIGYIKEVWAVAYIKMLGLMLESMKESLKILFFISCLFIIGCDKPYKAGNLDIFSYPVETPLRTQVVAMYLDTLIAKYGYQVPVKWIDIDKLVDFDSANHKRIYFAKAPEEMYLISYPGMLILADVYNPGIVQQSYVANRQLMPPEEKERVLRRFKIEILDRIEQMTIRDNLPDSVIYK